MYIGAAMCMLGLRGWKIGQLEQKAAEEEKKLEEVDGGAVGALDDQTKTRNLRSNLIKRLVMWKKV